MPLVSVVSTAVPEHEPIDVRVGGAGQICAVVFGGRVTQFVPVEHMAAFSTAIQAAVASAVITTRPE